MAHFRAVIQGQRGEASRLGSKNSGIDVSANGWTGGVEVRGRSRSEGQTTLLDEFTISATSGSGGQGGSHGYVGSVIGGKFFPSEGVKVRVIEEYLDRIAEEAVNGTRFLQRSHDTKLAEKIKAKHIARSGGVTVEPFAREIREG